MRGRRAGLTKKKERIMRIKVLYENIIIALGMFIVKYTYIIKR